MTNQINETKLRTVFGGTITLDAYNFDILKRGVTYVFTIAKTVYHRDNIVWSDNK